MCKTKWWNWLAVAGMLLSVWCGVPVESKPAWGVPGSDGTEKITDLKDILEKGLRARLPQDFAFINKVVILVNEGRLPRDLVMSTFHWARKKEDGRQTTYFKQALILRAHDMGIYDI